MKILRFGVACVWLSSVIATSLAQGDLLSPKTQGKSVSTKSLKVGDILLSRSGSGSKLKQLIEVDAIRSKLIQFGTNGAFSHAAVVLQVGTLDKNIKVVEAVLPEVREQSLVEFMDDSSDIAVLRCSDLNSDLRKELVGFLTTKIGAKYDKLGAASCAEISFLGKSWKLNLGQDSTKFYCSELIVTAFGEVGIDIVRDPKSVIWSPKDLADLAWDGRRMEYVGHLKWSP